MERPARPVLNAPNRGASLHDSWAVLYPPLQCRDGHTGVSRTGHRLPTGYPLAGSSLAGCYPRITRLVSKCQHQCQPDPVPFVPNDRRATSFFRIICGRQAPTKSKSSRSAIEPHIAPGTAPEARSATAVRLAIPRRRGQRVHRIRAKGTWLTRLRGFQGSGPARAAG